jgi:serine/threonine protein kinase
MGDAPPPLEPSRFVVRRKLGEGAFGEVLEATDTDSGESVALKRVYVKESAPGCESLGSRDPPPHPLSSLSLSSRGCRGARLSTLGAIRAA